MTARPLGAMLLALCAFGLIAADDPDDPGRVPRRLDTIPSFASDAKIPTPKNATRAAIPAASPSASPSTAPPASFAASAQTMALFALMSFAPAFVLMLTSFVRIHIVLTLVRQALGSPQVPGNQVLIALTLMLTALIMRPVGESVYERAIKPYSEQKLDARSAFQAGSAPIKAFMIEQLVRTHHVGYCWELYDRAPHPADEAEPDDLEDFSLTILAPAYLLSELTTALYIGFAVYLPFLVIDLVVSAVLAAMGLFMMPPALVAMPLKLILFVLADGWMLVSGMLLRGFGSAS